MIQFPAVSCSRVPCRAVIRGKSIIRRVTTPFVPQRRALCRASSRSGPEGIGAGGALPGALGGRPWGKKDTNVQTPTALSLAPRQHWMWDRRWHFAETTPAGFLRCSLAPKRYCGPKKARRVKQSPAVPFFFSNCFPKH